MSTITQSAKKRWEFFSLTWYVLKRNPLSIIGFLVVLFLVLMAIFAPFIAPHNPYQINMGSRFQPPSLGNLMGTDQYGRDILSRIIYASRIDMVVAFLGVTLAVIFGCFVGSIAGYYGGKLDEVIMRIMDSQQAFPHYVLAMILATVLGRGLENIVFVVAFVDYPIFARLIRAEIISAKESQYTEAARCVGNSNFRIIVSHLIPNCIAPVYVTASLLLGGAVMLIASLSFLGLGVRPPLAEWGLMVSEGSRYIVHGRWWMSLFPGFMVWLTMFGFNLFGDGLQDVLDPKRR